MEIENIGTVLEWKSIKTGSLIAFSFRGQSALGIKGDAENSISPVTFLIFPDKEVGKKIGEIEMLNTGLFVLNEARFSVNVRSAKDIERSVVGDILVFENKYFLVTSKQSNGSIFLDLNTGIGHYQDNFNGARLFVMQETCCFSSWSIVMGGKEEKALYTHRPEAPQSS